MRWILSLFLFLSLGLGPARAGYTILQQIEGIGSSSEITVLVEGEKMRSDVAANLSIIVDGESGDSIFLNHGHQTFSRVTAEQARRLGERVAQAQTDADSGKLVATGEKKMVGNYATELYTWAIGAMKMRLWISRDFPNGPAVQARLDHLQQIGVSGIGARLMPPAEKLPGIRVRTELELQGQKVAYTILSVKEGPVAAEHFTIPTGYRETPFAVPAIPPK